MPHTVIVTVIVIGSHRASVVITRTAADSVAPPVLRALLGRVNRIPTYSAAALERTRRGAVPPLFAAYPRLAARIPWRPLGDYPTPIEEVPPPESGSVGGPRLFIKRDDLSSAVYGGNKVRKLEYFLAAAELGGAGVLCTLGGIGSNHALATALHGRSLGFAVDLVLYPQPSNDFVVRNLGAMLASRANLFHAPGHGRAFLTAYRLGRRRREAGRVPTFIMVGGSSRLGCIGHVNAAFELATQIAAGILPEPDTLFIPLGTCGTAAGLIVGLRLAGLQTRVVAVRVADPIAANPVVLRFMAQDVADFLHESDGSIPRLRIGQGDFDFVADQYGAGYGVATAACEGALAWARPHVDLDTTYSAKALAACLRSCREGDAGGTVLFWNSYNSAPLPTPDDWAGLPEPLVHLAPDNRR